MLELWPALCHARNQGELLLKSSLPKNSSYRGNCSLVSISAPQMRWTVHDLGLRSTFWAPLARCCQNLAAASDLSFCGNEVQDSGVNPGPQTYARGLGRPAAPQGPISSEEAPRLGVFSGTVSL
jgi:hypothetical protein